MIPVPPPEPELKPKGKQPENLSKRMRRGLGSDKAPLTKTNPVKKKGKAASSTAIAPPRDPKDGAEPIPSAAQQAGRQQPTTKARIEEPALAVGTLRKQGRGRTPDSKYRQPRKRRTTKEEDNLMTIQRSLNG